jgi:hypothetical protein
MLTGLISFFGITAVFGQTVSVPNLTFGTLLVGSTSAPQTVTLTNNSTFEFLRVLGFSVSSGYTVGSTCPTPPAQLNFGASCTFTITFAPTTSGSFIGSLNIQSQFYDGLGIATSGVLNNSVGLNGTAVIPTPTPLPTATPTATAIPTLTPTPTLPPTPTLTLPPPTGSGIGGTIRLDGKPYTTSALRTNQVANLFEVRLDPLGTLTKPDQNGYYLFGSLQAGTYIVRVLYDPTKVQPVNGRDFSNQTVTGTTIERAIDFDFVSVQQQPAPTASFTPQPPAVTTQPATAIPATPTPTNTPQSRPQPQCPPQIDGNNLQIAMQVTPVDANFAYLCIRATQGRNLNFNADLSNTIEVNAPANILESIASTGKVTVNASTAIWSVGVLNPGDTATLILGIGTSAANLNSLVTKVTGTFGIGDVINRIINGIVPLTEIAPSPRTTNRPGSANNVVPVRLPSTGSPNPDSPLWWSVAVLITLVLIASASYFIGRNRHRAKVGVKDE